MILRTLLVACAALLAGACGGEPRARPSVVLVLVDQLRKDSADRWLGETRALAERGVRCEAMRSAAPWTYPSVISLLSGLWPPQHGADANQEGTRLTTISDAVPLLPRTLRAAGYHTAGFVTNPFLHEWNRPLVESFDHYDASFILDQGPTRGHGEKVWTERMWAENVNAAVRAHFDGRSYEQPEFVYVHYIDVHGRKEGPERWAGAPFEPSYEAATRHVDARIRELYDYFLERTRGELVFLVTSDHGQDADDDLRVGDDQPFRKRKASLHDFNLLVPLYVLPSRVVPEGRVLEGPCANVDVVPTLLEWLELPPGSEGAGTSLLPALRGEPYDGDARALYARNSFGGRFEECLVHARRKLTRYRQPPAGPVLVRRLVDLASDPRELHSLAADSLAEEALLDGVAGAVPVFPAALEELDEATRARLEDLGYGGGDDPAGDEPKDEGEER